MRRRRFQKRRSSRSYGRKRKSYGRKSRRIKRRSTYTVSRGGIRL